MSRWPIRTSAAFITFAVAGLLAWQLPVPAAYAEEGAASGGEAVFLAHKCNLCHGVQAVGIEGKAKSEKVKGPDLPVLEPQHTAQELEEFLHQRTELDGHKHKKPFKGTDEELKTIVGWLVELAEEQAAESGGAS